MTERLAVLHRCLSVLLVGGQILRHGVRAHGFERGSGKRLRQSALRPASVAERGPDARRYSLNRAKDLRLVGGCGFGNRQRFRFLCSDGSHGNLVSATGLFDHAGEDDLDTFAAGEQATAAFIKT